MTTPSTRSGGRRPRNLHKARSRGQDGGGLVAALYGDLRRTGVCLREDAAGKLCLYQEEDVHYCAEWAGVA